MHTSPAHPGAGTPPPAVWLRRFSKLLVLATLLLIFFGGQVKSHDAGLAVPDWPLTYGENPITYHPSKWVGGIFHEHFHRLFAGVVALMTVGLAVALGFSAQPRWLKVLGAVAVFAVLLQALLGGLTVIFLLPTIISKSHAILAQTFFLITVAIAYGLSREYQRRKAAVLAGNPEPRGSMYSAALVLIALVYAQLFLGALMRHTDSALAIPDFPLTAGRVVPAFNQETLAWVNDWRFEQSFARGRDLPDVTLGQMLIHFAHRVGALLVTAAVLLLTWLGHKRRVEAPVMCVLYGLCALVALQFSLGAFTIWTARLPLVTSLHVAGGAAVLALTLLLALRARPLRVATGEEAQETAAFQAAPAR